MACFPRTGLEAVGHILVESPYNLINLGGAERGAFERAGYITAPYNTLGPLVAHADTQGGSFVPLPSALAEELVCHNRGGDDNNIIMGMLPEIKRAWIAAHGCLYLWNYTDGSYARVLDGIAEAEGKGHSRGRGRRQQIRDNVVTVALCKAQEGAFEPNVSHVLVVVTVAEVLLLEVVVQNDNRLLFRDSSYQCSSDEGLFLGVCGSPDGKKMRRNEHQKRDAFPH